LARANPYVDECIIVEGTKLSVRSDPKALQDGRGWNLNPAEFGIGKNHQVDAYLKHMGISVPDEDKEIILQIPDSSVDKVNRLLEDKINSSHATMEGRRPKIVLLHAAKNDPNRTWPAQRWKRLAQIILEEGYRVIATGDNRHDPRRGVHDIPLPGVVNLVDQLSPLEFTALCRKANLLITTDSGAVQLAGASNIAIAGIYTVIPGKCRLPYRHGKLMWNSVSIESECKYSGCYPRMKDEKHIGSVRAQLKAVKAGKMLPPPAICRMVFIEGEVRLPPSANHPGKRMGKEQKPASSGTPHLERVGRSPLSKGEDRESQTYIPGCPGEGKQPSAGAE
jgi:hypothetical protein